MRVVELGAAPGSWTQLAVQRVGPRGTVVAADLQHVEPVEGAAVLRLDVTAPESLAVLREHLGPGSGGRCQLLLSDMAPATSGQRSLDHHRSMVLASTALRLSRDLLAPGGAAVVKLFQGGEEQKLVQWARAHFGAVRLAKPDASRKESKEVFLVARGFGKVKPQQRKKPPAG